MTSLDWTIVALYMLGILAIGWHYSRKAQSVEDYLLGGRRIGPASIGISLFASLLSTISYFARPGEMVAHGPMLSAEVLTYPIVFLLVGYGIIPFFMKQQITTAYELLERRFGVGIRLLGASLFLGLRLSWMGVVIYVTTSQILVPIMRLPEASTPYVCFGVGMLTVAYTTLGGLRAVVATDVIQTAILLGGAFLTLVITSFHLGSVAHIFPQEWPAHWDQFEMGFNSGSRITVFTAMITGFLWWFCTASSDQIAIQRYLATKDLKTARISLAVSLVTTVISTLLLSLVGIALLAYFKNSPELLPQGANLEKNADSLFLHFVVTALPIGATGLVVAGLLAAAMSSLSSGINSTCSVIAVDFIDRFGIAARDEKHHVARTRRISWCVGLSAVIISSFVGFVPGNLMEICFRTANLLVGPLFLLFFMAIFIPWATSLGASVAAIAGTITAVAIAFFSVFDLSFVWILPAALAVGAVSGVLVSLAQLVYGMAFRTAR